MNEQMRAARKIALEILQKNGINFEDGIRRHGSGCSPRAGKKKLFSDSGGQLIGRVVNRTECRYPSERNRVRPQVGVDKHVPNPTDGRQSANCTQRSGRTGIKIGRSLGKCFR